VTDEIIFFSLEDWDDIWRRNQFLCAGLVKRNPGLRILFVAPARDFSNALRTGNWSALSSPARRAIDAEGRIVCMRPWKFLPNTLTSGRLFNEASMLRQVRTEARRMRFRQPLLWINAHQAGHAASKLSNRGVVYDVTDDWTTLRQTPRMSELTRLQDRDLCLNADTVIVCSERLHQMKAPFAKRLHLIPNGVDAVHYDRVRDQSRSLPEETRAWKKPVLGYTGSIHADRIDMDLIKALGRRLPHATIALIGPIMLSRAEQQQLEKIPNIRLTGPRSYEALPDYMRMFDVCMTPHLVTPFTESLNPIKLWDYLAVGKPIISTPVAGFRDYPEFVRLETDADGFARALGQALAESPELPERRRAEARRHSWDARLDAVEALIDADILSAVRPVAHV
jgi:glycosyltransferase involved in cell wall biosynthesis